MSDARCQAPGIQPCDCCVARAAKADRDRAVVEALLAFDDISAEIDRIHPTLVPMSDLSIEWGGKSIAAWQRVEEALKAARP